MNTVDDLRAAFTRLEARTPLTADTLATVSPVSPDVSPGPQSEATFVELAPAPVARPRRRAAIIGGGFAVAATIAAAVFVTSLSGGAGAKQAPAGGSPNSGTSTSAVSGPSTSAAPTTSPDSATTAAAPANGPASSSSLPNCPTENAAGVCGTSTNAAPNATASAPSGITTSAFK